MMTSPHLTRRRLATLWFVLAISCLSGIAYGALVTVLLSGAGGDSLANILRGALRGAVTAPLIGGTLGSFEIFVGSRLRGSGHRRMTFPVLVAFKGMFYAVVILASDWIGGILVPVRGYTGFGLNTSTLTTLGVALAFSTAFSFVMEVSQVLGPGVMRNMLFGRYLHPRREDRLIVFFDMRSSTAIAERIGDLAFHRLLNRFFTDLTEPVLAWGGVIHKYVGDEMIVTWPLDGRRDPSGAFAAVVAAHARLESLGDGYLKDFGVTPQFRAVLHAGEVVTGEMGEVKREIVLLGDTINTTARIEQLAKTLPGHATIASAAAIAAAPPPAGITTAPLGEFSLPGKSAAIHLYAVS